MARLEGTCLCVGLRSYRNFKYLTGFKSGYLYLESAAFSRVESAANSTVTASAMTSALMASSTILTIWLELIDNIRWCVVPRCNLIGLLLRDGSFSYQDFEPRFFIYWAGTVTATCMTKFIEYRRLRVLPRDDLISLLLRNCSIGYQRSQSLRHGLVFQFCSPALAHGIAELICVDAQDL
jgi:hypothetical protein